MIKLFLCLFLGGFLIISFSQDVAITNPVVLLQQYRAAEYTYQQAEKASQQKADAGLNTRAHQLYQEALITFQQLMIPTQQVAFDSLLFCLYLRAGNIYYKKDNTDSAMLFYKKAEEVSNSYNYLLSENQQYYSKLRSINIPHGLLYKQTGDSLAAAGRYYEAIQQYHQAIMKLDSNFANADIYTDIKQFTPGTPVTHLFSTLIAKGDAFTQLRPGTKNIKALNAALGAYHSALLLAGSSKETEAGRSLLKNIKSTIGNKPIKIYQELYEWTGRESYQHDAYLFDQQIKSLQLSANTVTGEEKKAPSIPSVSSIQQLIDRKTAILSYYMAGDQLSTFIITRDKLDYHAETLQQDFLSTIDSFRHSLSNPNFEVTYDPTFAISLYQTLISPIRQKLKGMNRLIIIPDNSMNYLPFEALQDSDKKFLLEEYSVQYQYSTALLGRNVLRSGEPSRSYTASYPDTSNDFNTYTESIQKLNLDSAQLVILKMTDTGGQLLKTNRVLNLSEAFTYAGCPNMITSVWKTSDLPAAFVTMQLLRYLEEGYSRDKALQLARLDLLRNDAIDFRHKTPSNWANMALIGEYEPPYNPTPWLLISIIASVIAAVVWVVTVKSNY
jgi:CHAT domain-containing protein